MELLQDCALERLTPEHVLDDFSCLQEDLNSFLKKDAQNYCDQLMGVTYLFTLKPDCKKIVCFLTVSNDVLNLELSKNNKKRKIHKYIPHPKQFLKNHYPSVKIGRLGICKTYKGQGVGLQLMNFIKDWFLLKNKTGCRFILVDAYNQDKVISYYRNMKFDFLFETEEEEKEKLKRLSGELKTRFMFFDLKRHAEELSK